MISTRSIAGKALVSANYGIMAEENKISPDVVKHLRVLAHDLSNALETIVQATYLLSQANPPENTRRWVQLIDQSCQEAVRLNQKLREILRSQS